MSNLPSDHLVKRLDAAGQAHLLQFWPELTESGRRQLVSQVEDVDLELIASLVAGRDEKPDFGALAARATPPPAFRSDGSGAAWNAAEARQAGEQAIAQGRAGAVIVAGGQGTRLGFDLPKGMFPIGPLSGRTLFEFFADSLRATGAKYNVSIPLYLMTSPLTHEATVRYWSENDYLGLPHQDVRIFSQGTMPAVDAATGKLLLASKDSLSLSPDGHGGTVKALQKSGCFDDAQRRGVDLLCYLQVDNPLVTPCDVNLIGHHLLSGSEMTTQVVRKRFPEEKVGNVVMVDGKVRIIEYSDLPDEAAQRRSDGELQLWAGNIGVHVMDTAFLARAASSADALPYHRAHKVAPLVNDRGEQVKPDRPNAIKFERFIFDLLPWAENAFVVEAIADEAFAPVKNADGAAHDTPELAKAAICRLHRRWLQAAGIEVAERVTPGQRVTADHYFNI
jgi:UDP-N-acetylglucosamine/UDP-N-acetylgalactosamine diphosphorylase